MAATKPAATAVVAAMEAALGPAIPVLNVVPRERPPKYVRVHRSGGWELNVATDGPLITVECWAPVSAETLTMRAYDILRDLPGRSVDYVTAEGDTGRAWFSSWKTVGSPAQRECDAPGFDRWTFTVQLGISKK